MRLARRLRSHRSDQSLSLSQLAVLGTLERHGPLTKLLAALAERGFIVRTAHPSDGRQHLVAPTEQAVQMIREDRRQRDAWLAQRLAELSSAERATLRQAATILERLATS